MASGEMSAALGGDGGRLAEGGGKASLPNSIAVNKWNTSGPQRAHGKRSSNMVKPRLPDGDDIPPPAVDTDDSNGAAAPLGVGGRMMPCAGCALPPAAEPAPSPPPAPVANVSPVLVRLGMR